MPEPDANAAFLARWRANEGGAERANYVLFLTELCRLLDLPQPDPADATHDRNDYVFERAVDAFDAAGQVSHRRIDLYRRGCFVLEAKRSREPGGKKALASASEQTALPAAAVRKPTFPRDAVGQTAAVYSALRVGEALTPAAVAAHFIQGRRAEPRIAATLAALERLGHVAAGPGGYRLRRAA